MAKCSFCCTEMHWTEKVCPTCKRPQWLGNQKYLQLSFKKIRAYRGRKMNQAGQAMLTTFPHVPKMNKGEKKLAETKAEVHLEVAKGITEFGYRLRGLTPITGAD